MISRSRKSCIPVESWLRIPATFPVTAAPTGLAFGRARSSAPVRMSDASPPQSRAWRIDLGIWRPASFVSSAMSPADSKP